MYTVAKSRQLKWSHVLRTILEVEDHHDLEQIMTVEELSAHINTIMCKYASKNDIECAQKLQKLTVGYLKPLPWTIL